MVHRFLTKAIHIEHRNHPSACLDFVERRDLKPLLSIPIVVMMLVCMCVEGVGESVAATLVLCTNVLHAC